MKQMFIKLMYMKEKQKYNKPPFHENSHRKCVNAMIIIIALATKCAR